MKREWFSKRLKFKVAIRMLVPQMLIVGLFSGPMLLQRRQELSNDLDRSATQVGEVIESNLIRAMMTHDLQSLKETIDEIAATQEDIGELMLIDKRAEIRIPSEGRRVGEGPELIHPTCRICHREQIVNRTQSVVFTDENRGSLAGDILGLRKDWAGAGAFLQVIGLQGRPRCTACESHSISPRSLASLVNLFAATSFRKSDV